MTTAYTVQHDPFTGKASLLRSDGATIPADPANLDYQAFRAWNAARATPLVVADTAPALRKPRAVWDVVTDLGNLSTAQKTAVWNDYAANQRWKSDVGSHALVGTLLRLLAGANVFAGNAADQTAARLLTVAAYVLDNPRYLVQPAFDATINVPGDLPS